VGAADAISGTDASIIVATLFGPLAAMPVTSVQVVLEVPELPTNTIQPGGGVAPVGPIMSKFWP
jgi:hypothetical protein